MKDFKAFLTGLYIIPPTVVLLPFVLFYLGVKAIGERYIRVREKNRQRSETCDA